MGMKHLPLPTCPRQDKGQAKPTKPGRRVDEPEFPGPGANCQVELAQIKRRTFSFQLPSFPALPASSQTHEPPMLLSRPVVSIGAHLPRTASSAAGRLFSTSSVARSGSNSDVQTRIKQREAEHAAKLAEAKKYLVQEGYDEESLWEQAIVWGDHDQFQHVRTSCPPSLPLFLAAHPTLPSCPLSNPRNNNPTTRQRR